MDERERERLFNRVADMLFDRGAVKFGEFEIKLHEADPGASRTPIYLNIRPVGMKDGTLLPEDYALIAELLAEVIDSQSFEFDYLCGIPNAGTPIADALEAELGRRESVVPRLRLVKEEGPSGRRIVPSGDAVDSTPTTSCLLLVDDVVTQADTKLEAIGAGQASGLQVEALVVLVDREQGGSEQVEAAGHTIHACFLLSELLERYVETGKITQDMADKVTTYIEANQA